MSSQAHAHDPVFSPGPHVLFKDGIEVHLEALQQESGGEREAEQAVAIKYGLTGDWVIGVEMPHINISDQSVKHSGLGDINLSTKYRFWRQDGLGVQESTALLLKVKLNTGENNIGSDTTDTLVGLTYGYESLKWYRWASVRYRFNQDKSLDNGDELQRGDRLLVDLAVGFRAQVNDYRAADTIWMLETNGEFAQQNQLSGSKLTNTGGSQWFVSPGVMWTKRNFALKAGIQLPVGHHLNGKQSKTDFRARLELEWHL